MIWDWLLDKIADRVIERMSEGREPLIGFRAEPYEEEPDFDESGSRKY